MNILLISSDPPTWSELPRRERVFVVLVQLWGIVAYGLIFIALIRLPLHLIITFLVGWAMLVFARRGEDRTDAIIAATIRQWWQEKRRRDPE